MWEPADPVRYLELVHQSRQTSSKGFPCGSYGSCDCECGDGTTATDMRILSFLTLQEQQWTSSVGEVLAVWMDSMMLILDAKPMWLTELVVGLEVLQSLVCFGWHFSQLVFWHGCIVDWDAETWLWLRN
jgi:hypothetical protein